jgi:cold shock CspA family protein
VRHSSMRGTVHHALTTGEHVEFDVFQGGSGPVARDVIRLGTPLGSLIAEVA